MEAMRRSVSQEAAPAKAVKPVKKARRAAAGQKGLLMPIAGKKSAKKAPAKKATSKSLRKSA
jgi:DNA end-binding protein Ku